MRNKQTKIVATISDLKCDPEFIKELYVNGMDVVRMNTAHQDLTGTLKVIENTRKVSDMIALMIDTKGPEVRTTAVESPIVFAAEDVFVIRAENKVSSHETVYVNYEGFVHDVPESAPILFDDGAIMARVLEKNDQELTCKIIFGGTLKSKKTVNVPSARLNLPSLSKKDIENIQLAIEQKVDFIAHSFVRNKEDVIAVQRLLDEKESKIKIIAKIENREGVENIDEILTHVYGVMVARGDLAVEIPAEEVPIIQKRIIRKCLERAKPVIIATQMLHSMMEHPLPTRAEVSDVANAILDGADAVMLSGETSAGKYPLEAVQMMARIAKSVEKERQPLRDLPVFKTKNMVSSHLAKSAVMACHELGAHAIVIATHSGHTARVVCAYRGKEPIFARCFTLRTARLLALSYGVYPGMLEETKSTDEMVLLSLKGLMDETFLKDDDVVVLIGGSAQRRRSGSTFIEINAVAKMLEEHTN